MKSEKEVVVTTPLTEKVLEELKYRTGESTTKKALVKAVNHYLECPHYKELESVSTRKK